MATFIPESLSSRLISHAAAFEPVRRALVAAASDTATVFPAVIARASDPRDTFSIKSGSTAELAGLKVGAFWHNNPARGLPRHNSTILLIDQDCGRIGAVVEAAAANAYRTAAANAVAAQALARPDSRTLAIFGAGNQALYEVGALARILPLTRVHVVARERQKAEGFAKRLKDHGVDLEVSPSSPEEACRAADVIVTATPSRAPLFAAAWVRPGTHVAGMGSDARGKHELPVELYGTARLFCDLPRNRSRSASSSTSASGSRAARWSSRRSARSSRAAAPAACRPRTSRSSTAPASRSRTCMSASSCWRRPRTRRNGARPDGSVDRTDSLDVIPEPRRRNPGRHRGVCLACRIRAIARTGSEGRRNPHHGAADWILGKVCFDRYPGFPTRLHRSGPRRRSPDRCGERRLCGSPSNRVARIGIPDARRRHSRALTR